MEHEAGERTLVVRTRDVQSTDRNGLLRGFSAAAYARLAGLTDAIDMAHGHILWLPNEPIEYVYFPRTAVCSILGPLSGTLPVEAVTVGHEGMLGTAVLLGAGRSHTVAQTTVAGS